MSDRHVINIYGLTMSKLTKPSAQVALAYTHTFCNYVAPKDYREAVRRQFEKHRSVSELPLVDKLIFKVDWRHFLIAILFNLIFIQWFRSKGTLELEETNALFKTKAHVMQYFKTPSKTTPVRFHCSFYLKFLLFIYFVYRIHKAKI